MKFGQWTPTKRTCRYCEKPFLAMAPSAKVCSKECAKARAAGRQKARQAAKRQLKAVAGTAPKKPLLRVVPAAKKTPEPAPARFGDDTSLLVRVDMARTEAELSKAMLALCNNRDALGAAHRCRLLLLELHVELSTPAAAGILAEAEKGAP